MRSDKRDPSTVLVYAYLIDEVARLVYLQSHGRVAILDPDSSQHWLSIADLFRGKPSRRASSNIEIVNVYQIGTEVVDHSDTDVFMVETKPRRNQKFWVDRHIGLIRKARWQNMTYHWLDLQANPDMDMGSFSLPVQGTSLPEITEAGISEWWSIPVTLAETGKASNFQNEGGSNTNIFKSAENGDTNAVQRLLAAKPESINATNAFGCTALHYAAMEGHLPMTRLLLEAKAYVDPKNKNGATPLWLASAFGRRDVVQLLISLGARIDTRAQDTGLTPLHIAALNGQKEIVDLLLAKGADINAVTLAGETPLRLAIRRGHEDVANVLRQHGEKE